MDSNTILPQDVEQGLQALSTLINGSSTQSRDFEAAYQYARALKTRFSEDPRVWMQLVLVCNLTDRNSEAREAQISARRSCNRWNALYEGDCERDHALYCIRHKLLWGARRHLQRARTLHRNDPNRLAAIDMASGCELYTRKRYNAAVANFDTALTAWDALDNPDLQWRFNCLRWQFKALVAQHGYRGKARGVHDELIALMRVYGSPDIAARVKLVARGKFCNKLDDLVESPAGHKLLRKLQFERLARYIISKKR